MAFNSRDNALYSPGWPFQSSIKSRARHSRRTVRLEVLEPRRVLAASVVDGLLDITGSAAGDDVVRIAPLDLVPPNDSNKPIPCFDVAGGLGDDRIELDVIVPGDGRTREFILDAGSGDNTTLIRFGDGTQGQVPPAGAAIRTSYRSGAGRDTFKLDYDGPIGIDFDLIAASGAGDDALDVRLAPVAPGVEPPTPTRNRRFSRKSGSRPD
jgi:hypothetical protein